MHKQYQDRYKQDSARHNNLVTEKQGQEITSIEQTQDTVQKQVFVNIMLDLQDLYNKVISDQLYKY